MKNKRLAKLVRNRPEKYPHELESRYGRILERILELWGTPQAEQYFLDLLVDGRGGRTGFPIKVAEEIYFLSELHSLTFNERGQVRIREETQRLVKAEKRAAEFRQVLEQRGFKFVPTEMFACVTKGDMANLVMFVNAGMDVNTPNERGWTPLMVALFEGQEEVALFLIKHGADPFFSDTTGYSPIHWAAFHGYVSVIRELAQRRVNLDAKTNFGWTPLLQASARGFAPAADTLLQLGAHVEIADEEGWTALHKACANGYKAVVDILIRHQAPLDQQHSDGRTALHIAVDARQAAIVAAMVVAGANPNIVDAEGASPLHLAAEKNEVKMMDLLLSVGAKRSRQDKQGFTPLMRAVGTGSTAAIRRLLAAGASIDETLGVRTHDGKDVPADSGRGGKMLSSAIQVAKGVGALRRFRLHEGVARNDFLGVRTAVQRGADPNSVGPDGMTPLEIAAAHGYHQMWGVLIDLGAGRRLPKR